MSALISTSSLLAVQKVCGIIVCKSCKIGLPSERSGKTHLVEKHSFAHPKARSHAKKASDAAKGANSVGHTFQKAYLHAPFLPPRADDSTAVAIPAVLPPLEGLETVTGYQCSVCPSCYTSEKGMKEHLSEKHQDHQDGLQCLWQACVSNGTIKLQSLFGGKKTRYFPVSSATPLGELSNAPVSQETSNADAIIENDHVFPEMSRSGASLSVLSLQHCDSESVKQIYAVLNAPAKQGENESYHSINPFLARSKLDEHLQDTNCSMKQATEFSAYRLKRAELETLVVDDVTNYLLNVPSILPDISPSVLQDVNLRGFKEFTAVSENSAKRYARNFARIAISAYRLQSHESFPTQIHPKVAPYFSSLQNKSINKLNRLLLLHDLLSSICFQTLDNIDSPRQLFLYQFVTFASVVTKFKHSEESFRFVDASDISPLLAAILYGITSCALTEIHALGEQAKSISSQASSSQCDKPTRIELNRRFQDVLSSFDESKNTASSSIRKLLTLAHDVNKAEDVNFIFDICQNHSACGIVNNVHIKMNDLGTIVRSLHRDIRSKIDEQLCGASLPEQFFSDISAFEDKIHEKVPGFSFLNHPTNSPKIQNYTAWIFEQITEARSSGNAAFRSSTSTSASESVVLLGKSVRRDALQKWLHNGKELLEKLLSCLHISSGSPARSTELETMTLYNTEYHPRNVYISQGRLVFVTRYSKSRWLTGGDKVIPRFPDLQTSRLFLTYLVLLRPLEALFIKALFGEELMASHMSSVFSQRGIPFTATRIRDIIRSTFHSFSLPIQYNHFRHYSAGIIPTITENSPSILREDLLTENRAIAHMQAGHSPETAEAFYARRSDDIPSLPTSILAKYRLFSMEWHRHMQLDVQQNTSNIRTSANSSISSPPNSNSTYLTQCVSQAVSVTVKKELETFSKALSITKKRSAGQCSSLLSPPAKRFFPTRIQFPPQRDSLSDLKVLLPSLRQVLKDHDAFFTSEMQLHVTAAVREGLHNLLVVMPTGSGKTLTFLLPAALEQSCSTVVFVPLAALVIEHVATCKSLGIEVATWETRNNHAQVYILSVDHKVQEIRSFLLHLQEHGRLKRVVIDEAHLLLTWFIFRSSIQRLPFVLQECNHSVQLVLLSATLPPSHRERLLDILSTPSILLYAAPTTRQNLRFTVIDSSQPKEQVRFVHHRSIMVNTMWSLLSEFLEQLCEQGGGKVLIFTLYRHETERIQKELNHLIRENLETSISVRAFHAGMSPDVLKAVHSSWKSAEPRIKVMVATSAFGTGLDVNDVRLVVHFGGSSGLLDYAQEAGRAGRDGKSAQCTIIYNRTYADEHTKKIQVSKNPSTFSNEEYFDEQIQEWELLLHYMKQNTKCRKNFIYSRTDGTSAGMCVFNNASENCDVCDDLLDKLNPTGPTSISRTLPLVTAYPSGSDLPSDIDHSSQQNEFAECQDPALMTPFPSQSPDGQPWLQDQSQDDPLPVSRRLSFSNTPSPAAPHLLPVTAPSSTNILHDFRAACHRLQNLCTTCLVFDLKHELIEHRCSHMRNRCRRCFQTGHQVSSCISFDPKRKNYCYGCSLSQIRGENVHRAGEFGRNCFMGIARNIAWAYWRKDTGSREMLAVSLFRDIEMSKLQQAESSESPDEESDTFYKTWLQTSWDGVPNIVRFLLWWKNALNNL